MRGRKGSRSKATVASRREAEEFLGRVGVLADEEIDLAESAMAFAVLDHPEEDLALYRTHLTQLARDVGDLIDPDDDTLDDRIAALQEVLIARHGYQGDQLTYDDIQNGNLLRVIDRRRGLPVALGILFLHTARALGWSMAGLNFPGHFLVRLECDGERAILDPFNEGQVRTAADLRELIKATVGVDAELTPEYYAEVGNRDILLRLQNNIKLRFLKADRIDKAIDTVEGMLLVAPEEPALWREAGLLHAHQSHLPEAITALEVFLRIGTDERALHQAATLVQQLKNRIL
ncbi:MAG TPA: transglutaminase-like domain-containing protein [Azospirillaceae bacterium]|nr:transglutaminase-like domain-containing protein [Azospirillaceae bacterium]